MAILIKDGQATLPIHDFFQMEKRRLKVIAERDWRREVCREALARDDWGYIHDCSPNLRERFRKAMDGAPDEQSND